MQKFIFIFLLVFGHSFNSLAEVQIFGANCQIEIYQLGKGKTTPLHQEVEWILQVKGYQLVHRETSEFDRKVLKPYQMFASYRAGDESLSGTADCVSENYERIGKRYTCSYELQLVTVTLSGELMTFGSVGHSIAQAGSAEGFYSLIRNQLMQLPSCR